MRFSSPTIETPVLGRRGTVLLVAALVTLMGGQALAPLEARAAEPAPMTYQGPTYPTAQGAPSADKPQSKLWFNDGAWWGLLRTPQGQTIHVLENHVWRDTGTVVDDRLPSTGDALWDGGKLYVASRVASGALRVVRLSYHTGTDTYSIDFSKQIASTGTESITIARDSLGQLWVSYTRNSRVYVAHSTTSDTVWTAPFLLPVPDNTVTSDDISAVIAFNGSIGVMYSDQSDSVMRFAVHEDGAPDSTWTMEDALSGPGLADDHINLKSLLEDDAGRIYAAVKTSLEGSDDASIVVLQRTVGGSWSNATAAHKRDGLSRAQLALDSTNRRVMVIMGDEGGGPTVYYKSTALGELSFAAGKGAAMVTWPGATMNDPSTTKQAVNAATGLVVLASDDKSTTKRYYHAELSLGGPTTPPADQTPPSAPTSLTATATSATAVALSWTASTDNVGVTAYQVLRNNTAIATSTSTSYTDTTAAAGTTYTYTVTARDAANNVSTASNEARVSTPTPGTDETVTLTAAADSYVASGSANANYGTAARLEADASPITISYLKFDTAAFAGRTVKSAVLQVRVTTSGSKGKQNVKLVADDTWTETGITYTNAPARGATLGSLGPTTTNTSYSVTLSPSALQPELGGPVSLALDTTSTDGVDIGSRQTTTPPKLVLTLSSD